MNPHIVTALVSNKSGVLNRVVGLFSRRGFNIDSLSVASTEDPNLSRMTIVLNGDEEIDQVVKQLNKLFDVKHVTQIDSTCAVARELLLIKVKLSPEKRPEVESTIRFYKAKAVDLSPDSVTVELTGEPNKIDAFINIMNGYSIIELVRTGLTALERGSACIKAYADDHEDF